MSAVTSAAPGRSVIARADQAPLVVVVLVTLVTHGYELTSFHLSIDEPWLARLGPQRFAEVWLATGRWASAVLELLLPRPLTPVVPMAIGIGLSVAAWWWLARRVLGIGPWPAAVAVSLAVSAPAYALIVTFAANIPTTGVAQVTIVAFAASLARWARRDRLRRGWLDLVGALLAAAVSYGIYDSALVSLAIGATLVAAGCRRLSRTTGTLVVGAAVAVAGAALSIALARIGQALFDVAPNDYRGQFFAVDRWDDVPVLVTVRSSLTEGLRPFLVTERIYQVDAPWVWLTVGLLLVAAVARLVRGARSGPAPTPGWLGTGLLVTVPFALCVLAAAVIYLPPLRTMVYLPLVWIGLVYAAAGARVGDDTEVGDGTEEAVAGDQRRPMPRWGVAVAATVLALAVLSQASVVNATYQAGVDSVRHDAFVVQRIDEERRALVGAGTVPPMVVESTTLAWGASPAAPVMETNGLSLLTGPPRRIAMFMQTEGLRVRVPTWAEVRRAGPLLATMPVYPRDGWVQVRDGLLLVRLS